MQHVMNKLDVIIRGGSVVTTDGVAVADVGIADGEIVAVGERLGG